MVKPKNLKLGLKIRFYFISLWLLFFLIFMITIDIPISCDENATFIGFKELLCRNWLALMSLVLSIMGIALCQCLRYQWRGAYYPVYKIENLDNLNYEYLTFLTTYIIPLISFNLSELRFVFILILLLVIIGFIFVRMDLYYGNPTLALMGYRLYRVSIQNHAELSEVVLITKDHLSKGDAIVWIALDKMVWIAKKNN